MCRLFGFRSNEPAPVHRSLVVEQNSLKRQSVEHKDGWGIAFYEQGDLPQVAHGLGPAHSDPEFDRVSRLFSSHAVVAHIRLASVGAVQRCNAHPFTFRSWTFAHNGTVRNFATHQQTLEARIDPALLPWMQGETDSERCFYLVLTELKAQGALDGPARLDQVARAFARTMHFVATVTDPPPEVDRPTSLNFLLTDGKLMVCSRRGRTLFISEQRKREHGPHPCPPAGTRLTQLVIASEELSTEDHWHEVPEDSIVGVDAQLVLHQWRMSDLLA